VILLMREIIEATGGKLLQGEQSMTFRGISTDSRTVNEGDLFIALKGHRFDGHQYALGALKKKAGGVMVEESQVHAFRWNGFASKAVVSVKDTLHALGDLAWQRRRRFGTPVVALTGSNGKTTTKELIAACLEMTFPILKTEGNLNNLIGLPLTLLRLTEKEKVVVLEMGMNVPGEIRRLTEIAEPDVGLITNIQEVHLEGLGNLERVKEEKGELFRNMGSDGTIVVNQDDPRVVDLARPFSGHQMTFGIQHSADVMAKEIRFRGSHGTSFLMFIKGQPIRISLPLVGKHFVPNSLAAAAVATHFGIETQKIKEAFESFQPFPMRMEVWPLRGGKYLSNDAYNANPRSMESALETLTEIKGKGRSIAVLGDMLELGDYSEEAHRRLGQRVRDLSIDFLITLGQRASIVVDSAVRAGLAVERARVVQSDSEAVGLVLKWAQEGDWILIKGSRGMAMERIAEALREEKN